jgi:serine/threonine-protein kinase
MAADPVIRRWGELSTLFDEAMDLDDARRTAFLDAVEARDADAAAALRTLLAAHERHAHVATLRDGAIGLALRAVEAPRLEPGARAGAYVIREELGRGGMGVVFRAERDDGQVRQEVAIKVLLGRELEPETLRRFLLERELVASFAHPHIARLFDAGETDTGAPFYVMELVHGEPITRYCDRRRTSLRDRLELFLVVCAAVQYAHGRLVLHRDIKPGNVLVTSDGTVKLIDFGIAKPLHSMSAHAVERTDTAFRYFSPLNAAPEQLTGETLGVGCDVYQLGTLLYEMLCGEPLFELAGLTPGQVERCMLENDPTAPSLRAACGSAANAQARGAAMPAELARSIRGDLDAIVAKALRKRTDDRYASVEQLVEDVRRYLDSRPVAATRGRVAYRVRKFAARHRGGVAVAALALAATGAFVAALLIQAERLAGERDAARHERDRADRVAELMVSIFRSADPRESLTSDMPIGKVLENGRRRLQLDRTTDPLLRARLNGLLADVYLELGDAQEAADTVDRVGTAYVSALGYQHEIEFALRRARIAQLAGDRETAARQTAKAIRFHQRLGDSEGRQWRAKLALYESSPSAGDPTGFFARLSKEMAAEASVDRSALIRVETAWARTLLRSGRLGAAQEVIARALKRFEPDFSKSARPAEAEASHRARMGGRAAYTSSDDPVATEARLVLADILASSPARLEQALSERVDVWRSQQRVFGERSTTAAYGELRVGQTLYLMGRDAHAKAHLEAACTTLVQQRAFPHWDLFACAVTRGDLYWATGDQRASHDQMVEAVRIADALGVDHTQHAVMARLRLGRFLAQAGDWDFAASLATYLRDVPLDPEHRGLASLYRAEILHRIGRHREARQEIVEAQRRFAASPPELIDLNSERTSRLSGRIVCALGPVPQACVATLRPTPPETQRQSSIRL